LRPIIDALLRFLYCRSPGTIGHQNTTASPRSTGTTIGELINRRSFFGSSYLYPRVPSLQGNNLVVPAACFFGLTLLVRLIAFSKEPSEPPPGHVSPTSTLLRRNELSLRLPRIYLRAKFLCETSGVGINLRAARFMT
jgi:hypothetical protein